MQSDIFPSPALPQALTYGRQQERICSSQLASRPRKKDDEENKRVAHTQGCVYTDTTEQQTVISDILEGAQRSFVVLKFDVRTQHVKQEGFFTFFLIQVYFVPVCRRGNNDSDRRPNGKVCLKLFCFKFQANFSLLSLSTTRKPTCIGLKPCPG